MVFHIGRIVAKRAASPTVTVLDLNIPSLSSFMPGQWVDFMAPPNEWVGGFSLSSSPRDLPNVTLAVKSSSQKPSQWVTTESKEGDAVEIQVGGTCVLRRNLDAPALFCAGGIGISPLLSMYREHVQERGNTGRASFLYLVPSEEELVFIDELVDLALRNGDRLVVSLTQQDKWTKPLNGVECLTGRSVMQSFLQSDLTNNAIYYICGPPSMLDEAVDMLEQRNVPPANILYEKWW